MNLRNGWWILVFFVLVASMLIVMRDASLPAQAAMVAIATWICQALRRRPLTEVTGRLDRRWLIECAAGCALGAALMLIPAGFLALCGFVRWTPTGAGLAGVVATIPLVAGVAAIEELLFRGFVFQRLVDGAGPRIAQVIVAAFFVLTHADALAAAGNLRFLAAANIFIASLLFGSAFLRTRSLALPLGIHFAANFTQGTLLGFAVSGDGPAAPLRPIASGAAWMTGGSFGLEASLPGLGVLLAIYVAFTRRGLRLTASRTARIAATITSYVRHGTV